MTRAYLIDLDPQGGDPRGWMAAYRLANTLLHAGVAVAWALGPFEAAARTHPRGTFVLPAESALAAAASAAERAGLELIGPVRVTAPLLPLGTSRVAIYGGGGAPYNYARILAAVGFLVEFIQPEAVQDGGLEEADVFMMPGGGLEAMKGQLDPLGETGCRAIDRWVRSGGMYLGSCAGAFDAALVSPSFVAVCPAQRCMQLINARVWNSLDTEWIGLASPGVGILRARVARPEHPVMFHLPPTFEIVHYNGPLFEPVHGVVDGASESEGLATVEGVGARFTPSEYFLRFSEYPGAPGRDTLIGRAVEAGVRTVVAGRLDRGRVVLFGSHPEFGENLVMDRVGVPALMLANAVFWQSSGRPRREIRAPESGVPPLETHFAGARASAERIVSLATKLRSVPLDPVPNWLREELAMSTFGLPPREIWVNTLEEFTRLAGDLDSQLRRLEAVRRRATAVVSGADREASTPGATAAPGVTAALRAASAALAYRVSDSLRRDFGFEGLQQALDRCEGMLRRALAGWSVAPEPSPNPYAHFEVSPYHLAAGSYLAASGVLANAGALASAVADQLDVQIDAAALKATAAGFTARG